MKLTPKDELLLRGVHPDLVKVVRRAAEITVDRFRVGEGLRSLSRQKQLVARGASKTMKSRHLTGHAVDLFAYDQAGQITWDIGAYKALAATMERAAGDVGVPIEAGIHWKTIVDGPHFQLPWKQYP